jgi:tRNA A-37 threonylcarbamoyl transferase component Bud32/tetratricopeptide (TPR) repeat protein/TolB-like protein
MTETLQTPVRELTTGSTFASRYQVIEELGHGGMGRVYKVQDTDIKEKIALKLLRPEITLDKEAIERFSNELKLARKISHRNVCRMFDLGRAEGTTFITMEFVPGEDLKSFLHRSKQLSIGTAISIARQVCEGLEEAHRLGVVHRDLKPGNIMIDKDGDAKIMDFGIARSLSGKGITGAGVLIGTPEYMSPEQVEGKDIDQRSDVYSLGVILYEMVTGRRPFDGETALSIAHKQKYETPEDPRTLNAQVPAGLAEIILRCLAKERDKRFQNAAELGAELGRIEDGLPTTDRVIAARKTTTSREITVKFRLNKLFVPVAGLLVVGIVTGFVLLRRRGPELDPNRVAVAVFMNQTGDPRLDSLGQESAQWITEGLTKANLFSVAPLPTPEALRSRTSIKDPLRRLAVETGAGKVVSGSYHLQGDTIRFYADIRDMKTGNILEALTRVDGPRQDPTKPMDYLRTKLMGALACQFNPLMKSFLSIMEEAPNFDSYREVLEGLKCFSRQDYGKCIEHLDLAAALDPTVRAVGIFKGFALHNSGELAKSQALVDEIEKSRDKLGKGGIVVLDYLQAWLSGDLEERYRLIKQIAIQYQDPMWSHDYALDAVNNNYPREAIEAFKKIPLEDEFWKTWGGQWDIITGACHMLGDHKRELKEARRARKDFPESLWALRREVKAVSAMGQIKEINRLTDESTTLASEGGWGPGEMMMQAGHELRAHGYQKESVQVLERAQQWVESRPQKEKDSADGRYLRGRILMYLERWTEAQALFETLLKEFPSEIGYISFCGQLAAIVGDRGKALGFSKLLEDNKTPYLFGTSTYYRALIAAFLGDKEDAVNLIREAIRQGYAYPNIHGAMALERLKDYPPYIQLMKPKG